MADADDRAESSSTVARLQQVARKVAAGGDLYRDILDAAVEIIGSDAGSIQVVDEERSELRLTAWRGFDPASAAYWAFVPHGTAATCGTALETEERVVVKDVEAVPAFEGSQDLREWRRSRIRAVQSTPLVSRDGRVVGMMSTHWRVPHEPLEEELRVVDVLARQAADLIDREQARVELESSRALLEDAFATARMAAWVWDRDGNRIAASTSMAELFGLLPGETLESAADGFALVHPEDRERHRAVIERTEADGAGCHHQFRIIRPRDGRIAWLEERATSTEDPVSGEIRMSGLVWDVTEAKEAETERNLREEREREFVANAAHELRTPVAAIVGAVAALEAGAMNEPADRDLFLGHLKQEGDRLTRLIDSLLVLARADSQEEVPSAPLAIKPLLDEIAAGLRSRAGIEVEVDASQGLTVVSNRGLLERVLANLAANAAEHAGHGAIRLGATATDGVVLIEVHDSGAGIDPLTAGRAFDRFYRGRSTPNGFGLGLSIARQSAAAIGAEIELVRHPEGGTIARVTLPRGARSLRVAATG